MAEFLTTKGTTSHIEDIIKEANKGLVLMSPYLQISESFFSRLKTASARSVNITIIYRKDELKEGEYKQLASLKNVELRSLKSLHAKCYYNEKEMVTSSMNMYEYSENNNTEMGISISAEKDPIIFGKAMSECEHIFQNSIADIVPGSNNKFIENLRAVHPTPAATVNHDGFCIHCGKDIELNPGKPYCDKCFVTWKRYNNPDYKEMVCHGCGNEHKETSMNIPQCSDCYKSWKKGQRSNRLKTG